MTKVNPIITGLDKPIEVWLGKRLEGVAGGEGIVFECPSCGYKMNMTDDMANLEYGSFYGTNICYNCETEFNELEFEVKATITVSIKEDVC